MNLRDVFKAFDEGRWTKDQDAPTNLRVHFLDMHGDPDKMARAVRTVGQVLGIEGITGGGMSRKYPGALVVTFASGPANSAALEFNLDRYNNFLHRSGAAQLECDDYVFMPVAPRAPAL